MSTNFTSILKECSTSKTPSSTSIPTPSKTKSSSLNSIKIWLPPNFIFLTKSNKNHNSIPNPTNKSPHSKPSSIEISITPSSQNSGESETLSTAELRPLSFQESLNLTNFKILSFPTLISNDSFWSFPLVSILSLIPRSFASMTLGIYGIHIWKLNSKNQPKPSNHMKLKSREFFQTNYWPSFWIRSKWKMVKAIWNTMVKK